MGKRRASFLWNFSLRRSVTSANDSGARRGGTGEFSDGMRFGLFLIVSSCNACARGRSDSVAAKRT